MRSGHWPMVTTVVKIKRQSCQVGLPEVLQGQDIGVICQSSINESPSKARFPRGVMRMTIQAALIGHNCTQDEGGIIGCHAKVEQHEINLLTAAGALGMKTVRWEVTIQVALLVGETSS